MTPLTPAQLEVIYSAPAWMPEYERILLYALVVGLRPSRVLEIGTFQGGSTQVVSAALDDTGGGRIVCVDPDPRLAPETWSAVQHRATIVAKGSPEALPEALEVAGNRFEFALIDGDHSHAGVTRDIDGTLPTLADDAYLLFHDAHFSEVRNAIDDALLRYQGTLTDAGLISRGSTTDENGVQWGGLRLLRFHAQARGATTPRPRGAMARSAGAAYLHELRVLRRRLMRVLRTYRR